MALSFCDLEQGEAPVLEQAAAARAAQIVPPDIFKGSARNMPF
jgi:hypothetical protein